MKYYQVTIPVFAHVTVFVEAADKDQAQEIAEKKAHLYDAEPIDFNPSKTEVEEIKKEHLPNNETLLTA